MTAARRRRPLDVLIAIGALNLSTIVFSHIGNGSLFRGDGKGSFGLGCHPAHMHPRMLQVAGNVGIADIPGAKSMREMLRLWLSAWQTKLLHQPILPAPITIVV